MKLLVKYRSWVWKARLKAVRRRLGSFLLESFDLVLKVLSDRFGILLLEGFDVILEMLSNWLGIFLLEGFHIVLKIRGYRLDSFSITIVLGRGRSSSM